MNKPHGDNLFHKEQEYLTDSKKKKLLRQIRAEYERWANANEILIGPSSVITENDDAILKQRVELLNQYKDFIDQQIYAEAFDSRSNLHSSVLEEFCYYLFRDLVRSISEDGLIGKAHAFTELFYNSSSYEEMVTKPSFRIDYKDHDFVIGATVNASFVCEGETQGVKEKLNIPAVAIECKTYLDKTMLEGASSAARQLMAMNPNALYIIISEWIKLADNVNVKRYGINQIYILRKQKNTDRSKRFSPQYKKNPIYSDVVIHLFNLVRHHLTSKWNSTNSQAFDKGFLIF